MLPILRILPVGGVLLAIMILVLALNPPGGSHGELLPPALSARGALLKLGEHPEWRQFLILAATRRADELSRLRDLPDTPVPDASGPASGTPTDEVTDKIAGLPADRSDADPDPDDVTGTIADLPAVTMPVEIGETSSTELLVGPREEKPPVIKTPKRVQTPKIRRAKIAPRTRRAKAPALSTPAKPQPAAPVNFFEALFGGAQASKPATATTGN